ncbi:MAG: UDP-N-acetylmuramate--L-alanine ligase [Microthrixaceae bacterium]
MNVSEPTPTAVPPFDLSRPRRVHVVAVGGAGMSAIATLLAEGGHAVSGSDLAEGPNLAPLRAMGVEVHIGHRADNVGNAEVVVASTAVSNENVELTEATRRGLPVLRRRAFLASFAAQTPFLSVAGTHGKTTTSSLLAVALRGAGTDPSWLLGAPVPALGGAASLGKGPWMVLEADESDASFLAGPRAGALLTNAEPDHLEFWGGWENLAHGFEEFIKGTSGPVVACADDPGSAALGRPFGAVLYGSEHSGSTERELAYELTDLHLHALGSRFTLRSPQGSHEVHLALAGAHNALNAVGALALAGELGVDLEAASAALSTHTGLHRRFEYRGSTAGIDVVDDYAHLPTEVRAALAAGSDGGWNRLVVVFQPHRYSRTEALWGEFGASFGLADVLVLTDIYAAGEAPRDGVSGRLVLDAVKASDGREPIWAPTLPEAAQELLGILSPGDLLLTVGAGDVRDVGDMVLEALAAGADAGTRDGNRGEV